MNTSPAWSQEKFIDAYRFAANVHRGQLYPGTRLPYLLHLSFVSMEILAAITVEEVKHPDLAVQCALLHDVIEDTEISYQQIEEEFGAQVADGVYALTKRDDDKKSQRLRESIKRILKQPKEVKMVKLADRISNLQQPPFHWTQAKIKAYRESSKVIHTALKNSSQYLGDRLLNKINHYEKYIK